MQIQDTLMSFSLDTIKMGQKGISNTLNVKMLNKNSWCKNFSIKHQMKGSQQQGALVHFSLFQEKSEKHNFWQFSKYVDFSCKNEQDMLEISEFRGFCNDFTA